MCDNCEKEEKDLIDVTTEAQKFLSCIKRTGEIFGTMHIVDVLRGSKSQKVMNKNHHLLSTYGIGKDISKEQWLNLSRQFIQKKIIEKDFEYGSLKVTGLGADVLKGNFKVKGKLAAEEFGYKVQKESSLDYDKNLFAILKAKRKEIADRAKVPPYVIFPDKSLIEMAAYFPQSENLFARIHGVGKFKVHKYAEYFLPVIIRYCRTNNITEKLTVRYKRERRTTLKSTRFIEIGEAYKESRSFEELLSKSDVKRNTIISHLTTYVREGNKINTDMLLKLIEENEEKQKKVFAVFEKLGTDLLKPVFDELEETVAYDDLRVLRLCYLNKHL